MKIAFIGLGHMGLPMAKNLLKAGHCLRAYDITPAPVEELRDLGAYGAESCVDAVDKADVILSILPEGKHVRDVYGGENGVLNHISTDAVVAECSTMDMATTRWLHEEAENRGIRLLDAPVSGGVTGAANGTLTFMVGGTPADFAQIKPILENMGQRIIHCGDAGTGQAAKICNNMVLGATMIASSEAFILAEKLGLSKDKFFEVASGSSAQNWSITSYCPVPGPVPTSPANRDYEAGFTAAMMLKDLKLAADAAQTSNTFCPMGAEALALYSLFCNAGQSQKDFSGIIQMLWSKKASDQ